MKVGLSVIMPSLGRSTLTQAVASCQGADEVIVLFDTDESADRAPRVDGPRVIVLPDVGDTCGGIQRTIGIRQAAYSHIAFMDDDDVFVPGGVETIRGNIHLDRPAVFRVKHTGTVVWDTPVLRPGNVSGLGVVVPNRPQLPPWPSIRGSDFLFVQACVEPLGEPVWRDFIVAECTRAGAGQINPEG